MDDTLAADSEEVLAQDAQSLAADGAVACVEDLVSPLEADSAEVCVVGLVALLAADDVVVCAVGSVSQMVDDALRRYLDPHNIHDVHLARYNNDVSELQQTAVLRSVSPEILKLIS